MTTESRQRIVHAELAGDYVVAVDGAKVYYEWGLANSSGAWFCLFRELHHTDDHIRQAKLQLRRNRDVVTMRVERFG